MHAASCKIAIILDLTQSLISDFN